MFGWTGKILEVDLSASRIDVTDLDPERARKFIGGRGLNSLTLLERIKPGIDPLSAENVICLAPGPLSGTPLGLTSRMQVSTLSPYSGILGDGNAGEKMAAYLKKCGFDQIIISGKADTPVYLYLEDGKARLLDASFLWGKSTWETTDLLKEVHGSPVSVACIGQAGENLVRFASTIVDKYASAARGSGAVLGFKNLKAIVARGKGSVPLADPDEFKELAREDRKFFFTDSFQREVVAPYGSHIGMVRWYPGYRNYEKILGEDEVPEELKPEAWKKYEIRRTGCLNCPVQCKDFYEIPSGERKGEKGSAMEHECIFCMGTNCGVMEPVPIMEMENLCDLYGMDVLAAGNTIAMIKDLYARGIISDKDTGGLNLEWEDSASQIDLVHMTALRQGPGNLVAEGMYSIARIVGGRAMDYCYHVKGLSRGPYKAGLFALAHATSTRGADHLRGRSWAFGENDPGVFPELVKSGFMPEDADKDPVTALITAERVCTLTDSIGRCKGAVNSWACAMPLVWKYPLYQGLSRLLKSATGVDFSEDDLLQASDRIYMLERCFNHRHGIRPEHDCLTMKPEDFEGDSGIKEQKLHREMLADYYQRHGIDFDEGIPSLTRLRELDLEFIAELIKDQPSAEDWDGPLRWPLDSYPSGGIRV